MNATLLRADTILSLDTQDNIYQPGYLVIHRDRLSEIGPLHRLDRQRLGDDVTEINLEGRLVMPGLVNAHTHTPMVLFRGLAEDHSLLTFEGWYHGIRVWEEVMDADMVPPAVAVSCAEMIRTGTTCFAGQYFYMDRIIPVVRQSGMRAALAYGIV